MFVSCLYNVVNLHHVCATFAPRLRQIQASASNSWRFTKQNALWSALISLSLSLIDQGTGASLDYAAALPVALRSALFVLRYLHCAHNVIFLMKKGGQNPSQGRQDLSISLNTSSDSKKKNMSVCMCCWIRRPMLTSSPSWTARTINRSMLKDWSGKTSNEAKQKAPLATAPLAAN